MGKFSTRPTGKSLTYRELFALPAKRHVRDNEDAGQISGLLPSGNRRIVWDDGCITILSADKAQSDSEACIWLCGAAGRDGGK